MKAGENASPQNITENTAIKPGEPAKIEGEKPEDIPAQKAASPAKGDASASKNPPASPARAQDS
jgi:hypothetical protein